MKRPAFPLALGLLFAAALPFPPVAAGADGPPLRPGLEIFDGGATPPPAPLIPFPEDPSLPPGQEEARERLRQEAARDDFMADPFLNPPAIQQPGYQAPDMGRPSNVSRPYQAPRRRDETEDSTQAASTPGYDYMDPYADPFADLGEQPQPAPAPVQQPTYYGDTDYMSDLGPDPFYDNPYGQVQQPYQPDPYAAPSAEPYTDPYGAPYPDPWQQETALPGTDPRGMPAPVRDVMVNLNVRNPYFPGLGEAATQGDINYAGGIILDTLRQRRVVDATMIHGVRGSVGVSSEYEMLRFLDVLGQNPQGYEDPLAAAQRVNVILDSFQQPMLDDPGYENYMPQVLRRLNYDTSFVRNTMYDNVDDGTFLELARTYVRAATTCDFLVFPRRELANDVKMIVNRSGDMFNPDGSSRAGDVGGITGNLFQVMLMMEFYTREDSWFRRDISSLWKQLERPGRYLLNVAGPDLSLPAYGPRGSRELLPEEVDQLINTFPPQPPRVNRIGLAASESFPATSGTDSYGGVYVMRDVKHPDGRYLSVRFGAPSSMFNVPSHEDFGSITLMNRGGAYLTDPGGYGGVAASGAAHGGMSLNNRHAILDTYTLPGAPSDAIWRTNASLDYATAMAGYEDGKTWQRSVAFVKPLPGETMTDYWVVLDHVDMQGDPNPQTARVRYQMAPGVHLYRDGPGVTATAGMAGTGLRIFAVDAGARIDVTDGNWGEAPGQVFDSSGGAATAPAVTVSRQLTGDSTTTTLFYPMDNPNHRPVRIERDSDIIRGRTGAIVIDHGLERVDVIAWAPPGTELVTPTLNLQLSADLAVFRLRRGKIARIDFVNLERFQAKEPDGGLWSLRVGGPAQTLTIEPERGGGWQVMADPANRGSATLHDLNFGPVVSRSRIGIKPGEIRVVTR